MIIVEVKYEHTEDYDVRCVSLTEFNNEQLVQLLKEEHIYGNDQVVQFDKHLGWSEDAVYFWSKGGMSDGVFVRQRRVKLYQATAIGNDVFEAYESKNNF